MELVIADPSASTTEAVKNSFQTIFTKCTKSSNAISHQEMCQRLLKNLDIDRRAVRFLMKQFVNDVNNQGQKSGSIGRAYEVLKQENTQLKQASSSQRLQMEQTIADLQHRVQALNGTVQGQQQKLQDKDKQLTRFRELYEADGMARIPSSSHSQSSGGKRGHSNMVNSSSHHQQQHQQQQQEQQHAQPPMQGFVMQKQARERAKEQALGEFTRRGPVATRPMTNESSLLTPMQLPRRPLSSGSLSSASGHHQNQHQNHHATVPSTPRIRDLSSSNGYVFSSSASGRGNGGGSGGGSGSGSGHPMQHGNGNGSKHPRRTTDSPSSGGFAFNQGNQARQQQQQRQQSHNYGAPRFNSRG
jgi:hypothetical protein